MTHVVITIEGDTELPDELNTGELVADMVGDWREQAGHQHPEIELSYPATIELDDSLSVTVVEG
jgi:hypothetical protein